MDRITTLFGEMASPDEIKRRFDEARFKWMTYNRKNMEASEEKRAKEKQEQQVTSHKNEEVKVT